MSLKIRKFLRCTCGFLAAVACPSSAMAAAPHDLGGSFILWLDGFDISGIDTGAGASSNPGAGASVTNWVNKANPSASAGVVGEYGFTAPLYEAGKGVMFGAVEPSSIEFFNDMLELPLGLYGATGTLTASDIFLVSSTRSISESSALWSGAATGSASNRINIALPRVNGTIHYQHGASAAGAGWAAAGSQYDQAQVWNFSANGSTLAIARNGSGIASATQSSNYAPDASHRFFVGGQYDEDSFIQSYPGTIGELLVFSRKLKAAERNILHSYLAARHGIAGGAGAGASTRYDPSNGFAHHVGGIGLETDGEVAQGTSAGLTIAKKTYASGGGGQYVIAGVSSIDAPTGSATDNVPAGVSMRSARQWYVQSTASAGSTIQLSFDLPKIGLSIPSSAAKLALLRRTGTSGPYTVVAQIPHANGYSPSFEITAQTGYYALGTVVEPAISAVISTMPVYDGVNAATNPKMIPGALVRGTANVVNSGNGSADSGSTAIIIAVPSAMKFHVGDIGTTGSGPVTFSQGATTSGLAYVWGSLNDTNDGIDFSADSGASWTYVPTADAQNADSAVTNVRVKLNGAFASGTSPNFPSFSVNYGLVIK